MSRSEQLLINKVMQKRVHVPSSILSHRAHQNVQCPIGSLHSIA